MHHVMRSTYTRVMIWIFHMTFVFLFTAVHSFRSVLSPWQSETPIRPFLLSFLLAIFFLPGRIDWLFSIFSVCFVSVVSTGVDVFPCSPDRRADNSFTWTSIQMRHLYAPVPTSALIHPGFVFFFALCCNDTPVTFFRVQQRSVHHTF